MKHQNRSLRIIGGNWRGRKITFPEHEGIRPTGDRVRETLFNWLMHDIRGARCLDLFAGSGILSFEALSRGASHVTLVESDRDASSHILRNLSLLEASPERFTNIKADAIDWIGHCSDRFDVIFIDPPFDTDFARQVCRCLVERNLAAKYVYIETPAQLESTDIPDQWSLYRQKRAAAVHYSLCITG